MRFAGQKRCEYATDDSNNVVVRVVAIIADQALFQCRVKD